jgi:hypothetical protein
LDESTIFDVSVSYDDDILWQISQVASFFLLLWLRVRLVKNLEKRVDKVLGIDEDSSWPQAITTARYSNRSLLLNYTVHNTTMLVFAVLVLIQRVEFPTWTVLHVNPLFPHQALPQSFQVQMLLLEFPHIPCSHDISPLLPMSRVDISTTGVDWAAAPRPSKIPKRN